MTNNIQSMSMRRGGFTLIETVLATLFASVLVVGALNMSGAAVRTQQVMIGDQEAEAIARDLLSEVIQMPYEDQGGFALFGLESGEVGTEHAIRDDVDDYHGLQRNPQRSLDSNDDGNYEQSEFNDYNSTVEVVYVDPDDPGTVVFTDQGVKRITVTVTDQQGETVTMAALRTRMGPVDSGTKTENDIASSVVVVLQLGDDPEVQRKAKATLLNRIGADAVTD